MTIHYFNQHSHFPHFWSYDSFFLSFHGNLNLSWNDLFFPKYYKVNYSCLWYSLIFFEYLSLAERNDKVIGHSKTDHGFKNKFRKEEDL